MPVMPFIVGETGPGLLTHLNRLVAAVNKTNNVQLSESLSRTQAESGSGVGVNINWVKQRLGDGNIVKVYRRISDNASAGHYECILQVWEDSGWVDVGSTEVTVKNHPEIAGHSFTKTTDLFMSVGLPSNNGVVPVVPLGFAHMYDN